MSVGISLGYNCRPTCVAVDSGWRQRKEDGYKTCPFDLCITPFEGMIECIKDDFSDFVNPQYLKLIDAPADVLRAKTNEELIYNTKYNIVFLHESPGHADLYQKENWPEGMYHFVANGWQHFQERYSKRIENFRTYLNSGASIHFVLSTPNPLDELEAVLDAKYPTLDYKVTNIGCDIDHYNTCVAYANYRP